MRLSNSCLLLIAMVVANAAFTHPKSHRKSPKTVAELAGHGIAILSAASSNQVQTPDATGPPRAGDGDAARRPDEHGRKRYRRVPRSASSSFKGGNCFSSATRSSEIAKDARSTGGGSGLRRSRCRSQSRIATRSSLNAALTKASKNLSRCPASSLDRPYRSRRNQIDGPHSRSLSEKRIE